MIAAKKRRIRVYLLRKRKNIYMRYQCPLTGKYHTRSTYTRDPCEAEEIAMRWEGQVNASVGYGAIRAEAASAAADICGYPPVPRAACRVDSAELVNADFPGVYFIWRDSRCVYVGMSRKSVMVRITKSHAVVRPDDHVSWVAVGPTAVRWAECFYIGCLRPEFNFPEAANV